MGEKINQTDEPEYIELNMANYDEDQVSQLNEWGIWAFAKIEELEAIIKNEPESLKWSDNWAGKCEKCGAHMHFVRPGKSQCRYCG